MNPLPLWLRDLAAYSIQAAALVAAGSVAASLLRLRAPRVRLAFWQALLALCLFLPLLQPWRPEILESAGAGKSGVLLAPASPSVPTVLHPAEIVLVLLLFGIAARAAWLALGMYRLRLYRRQGRPLDPVPPAVEDAQRLAPVFPAMFISHRLRIPATFGCFRPAILFPARLLGMEPSAQKLVALHELLHVERRDWLWNLVEEAALTLLWFQIPLWWVVRCARLSREEVVDAEAIRRSNARRPYMKALLEMAGQKPLAESLPASLFLRESQLADRVSLMMKEVRMSRARLSAFILTSVAALAIAGASVVYAFPLRTTAQVTTPLSTSTPAAKTQKNVAPLPAPSGDAVPAKPQPAQSSAKADRPTPKVGTPDAGRQNPASAQAQQPPATTTFKIDRAKIRQQIEQARKQALLAEQAAAKIDRAKIQQQVEKALKQADIARRMSALKINQADIQRKIEQARKQALLAEQAAAKIDQAKIQQQVAQAMQQAAVAQKAATQIEKNDRTEIQREMEQARRQLQEAQQEAEQARKTLEKDRMKLREQLQKAAPSPQPSPNPLPSPPAGLTLPSLPPSPRSAPAPPPALPTPQSAPAKP